MQIYILFFYKAKIYKQKVHNYPQNYHISTSTNKLQLFASGKLKH